MNYLNFDKRRLVNLEYSLEREFLRSNRAGAYTSSTIAGCNTRKYHGLLVCPVPELDDDKHVLLSSVDETVIQHKTEFNLGIHKYPGEHYDPKGHKYIRDFDAGLLGSITYRVGGVVLRKELLLTEKDRQILICYTLLEAHSPTVLRFKPFVAFRSVHRLGKANMCANVHYTSVANGICLKLYAGYPALFLQFSKEPEFVAVPDWYNNIEYFREKERGYAYLEDLFVPGYFELPIIRGESLVLSASTSAVKPGGLKARNTRERKNRLPNDSFINCLTNAAAQFITRSGSRTDLIAGFPWYNSLTRQTLIALPGLSLAFDSPETFREVIGTVTGRLDGGLFPKGSGGDEDAAMDTPLWLFWSLQQYVREYGSGWQIWKEHGVALKEILGAFRSGTRHAIRMEDDGLIAGGTGREPLSWMDSCVDGNPVVPRTGKPVEVNALWYNALRFALELAGAAGDGGFVREWKALPGIAGHSLVREFWDREHGYLADCINGDCKDWTVRPNMVIAAAMPYTPFNREMREAVLSVADKQLLTPRGLRTLTPENEAYDGRCEGSVSIREKAIHQGVAWPWLIQFFIEGYLDIHRSGGLPFVKRIIDAFEADMTEDCIGTIAEMYNGDPPYNAGGAVSQAWSVGAVIRSYRMYNGFSNWSVL
ncbi:MAG: amylo-alpha-1,6-glucosidase [Mangrovibacterium sp.]